MEPEDPRKLVLSNDDLWGAVLGQLCARHLSSAVAACRGHRSLREPLLSERDALFVAFVRGRIPTTHVALTERLRSAGTTGLPLRCERWRSNGLMGGWSDLPHQPGVREGAPGVFLTDTELKRTDCWFVCTQVVGQLLARFPALEALSLDLGDPHRDLAAAIWETKERQADEPHGPAPLALFPRCAVTELRIKDAAGHEDLLLTALVSLRSTLLRLDLSGLADIALPTLLHVELPQLQLLRLGDAMDSRTADRRPNWRCDWPRGVTLDMVGPACPSLTALDVGFASLDGGVQIEDLLRLCRPQRRLRHLDLSQVMTYRDFDPGVAVLRQHAPQLESLALYGLHVSDEGLASLAQLRRLTTAHLVACSNYSAAGLAHFLEAAPPSLRSLDLSFALAPVDALRAWLRGRAADAPPTRLTLVEAYAAEERRLLLTAAQFEQLLEAGAAMLVALHGAVRPPDPSGAGRDDRLSADHGEHVARRVGVTGPVAARYTQESQEAWVELQQRYGLRIMDALAAQ